MAQPRFVVVLVRPKYAGNVGAVARAMRNFGLEELWLVGPPAIAADPEGRKYAMHAWDILDKARPFPTLEACLAELDLAVGSASDIASNEKRDYIRVPLRVREFAERASEVSGTIGLIFGPEDFGLTNAEVERCDALLTIPANHKHPSLNLSHAVAVVLYEITQSRFSVKRPRAASREETEKMLEFVARILDHMELPEHRKRTTILTFRKMLGRAMMSRWEYHRLMGVFSGAVGAMEEVRAQGKRVRALRRVHKQRKPKAQPVDPGAHKR